LPRDDYGQVFQNTTAVERYEDVQYAPDSQSTAVNERQRRYLRRLVRRSFRDRPPTQHDFACGTGRAIGMLQGLVSDAHGYDTSAEMMERGRLNGYKAQWHLIDEDGPVPVPEPAPGPAVVTVFRLLLNVPDAVRERAVAFAAEALPRPDSGLLVLQNHGSDRSLRHLRARRRAGDPWFNELSDQRVGEILAWYGFELVARRGCAMFPRGWYRPKATRPLVRALDDLLCAVRLLDRYAVDVLYVARRATG
jgi:SAM-dependent methyltransferase